MQRASSRILIWLATGFGTGYSPVASGTVGTLPGILVVFAVAWFQVPLVWQIVLAVALSLAAIPVADHAEKVFGRKDDGRVVIDEYATFLIGLLGIPWLQHPWFLVVAFIVARIFDIVKPPPARQSQVLKGGLGIVADDVLASFYTLALNWGLWAVVVRVMA